MPIHRTLEALEKKELVLVKPKKWDDPFENALLSAPVVTSQGEKGEFAARESVYGQCWTQHKETDAMWRIYSPDKNGAKVRTTPRKLLEALKAHNQKYSELQCFVGQVTYLKQSELSQKLRSLNLFDSNGSGIAESLLYKRKEFSHEKEIRIIYSGLDNKCISDFYAFRIDPYDLFEEIIFDPRMDSELVCAYKLAIKNKGYSSHIKQSTLYKRPKDFVIKI